MANVPMPPTKKQKAMTDEYKFDVARLQAMQVPLAVRVVQLRGTAEVPYPVPPGSLSRNNQEGTGYTREEVQRLESDLGPKFGGGHYVIAVVDANGETMKWKILLDHGIFAKKEVPIPQPPLGSSPVMQTPSNPQPPMGTGPVFPSWHQSPQQMQQNPSAQTGSQLQQAQPFQGQQPQQMQQPGGPWSSWNGQQPMNPPPPWMPPPGYPYLPQPYWPPQQPPPQPNNSNNEQLLRLELRESMTQFAISLKDEMRAVSEKAASAATAATQAVQQASQPKSGLGDVTELVKLGLPFAPQILSFLSNRTPKEDSETLRLKEELRGLRESLTRQEERRAQDAERQQMLHTMETIQGSLSKELETVKASMADRATSNQVGVLDRIIDAFRGMSAEKPVPQGLQLQELAALVAMFKESGGKGGDLRETIGIMRDMMEMFGGSGGESSIWKDAIGMLGGITQQAIQAKAVQAANQRPVMVQQHPVQIPAHAGLNGAPQVPRAVPAPQPLPQAQAQNPAIKAAVSQQLQGLIQQLRNGAKEYTDSSGVRGLRPDEAGKLVKEAYDRLKSLGFENDLSRMYEAAKFGELAAALLGLEEGEYLDEFVGTLEELTGMEASDVERAEGEEEEERGQE